MLIKINRQEAINRFPNLPLRHYDIKVDEEVFNYSKVFANYILTLSSKSYKGHIKLLGSEIVEFATSFGFDNLIFLGDENTSWLHRFRENKTFEEALQYLVDNKIGKRFNGAIQVDLAQIPIFIKHLAWLVRTNGVLPYIHFVDVGQNIIGNICQHGNLHISTKSKNVDKQFKKIIAKSKFEYLTDAYCYDKFSKRVLLKADKLKCE